MNKEEEERQDWYCGSPGEVTLQDSKAALPTMSVPVCDQEGNHSAIKWIKLCYYVHLDESSDRSDAEVALWSCTTKVLCIVCIVRCAKKCAASYISGSRMPRHKLWCAIMCSVIWLEKLLFAKTGLWMWAIVILATYILCCFRWILQP